MTGGGRTFAALVLPPELRRSLSATFEAALANAGEKRTAPLRRAHAAGLHLTLLFAGSLTTDETERWRGELRTALTAAQAPQLRVGPLGAFPEESAPRVLWAGVEDVGGGEHLARLQRAVSESAGRAALPVDRAPPFRPHVTLARARRGTVSELPAGFWSTSIDLRWSPSEVTLLRSRLEPTGARYEPLERYRLVPPAR